MRTKLESRTTAWIITGLVVLFAVLLGGRASLLQLRAAAWEEFAGGYEFAEEEGHASLSYDLGEIASNAHNLITVAGRYTKEEAALFEAIRADAEIMTTNPALSVRKLSADSLRGSVRRLDDIMGELPMVDEDRAYQAKLTANIESRYMTIEHSPYNTLAEAFNRELSRQPAGVIAAITGIERLELYA